MQSFKAKTGTSEQRTNDLADRLLTFAVMAIKATYQFANSPAGLHIGGQLIRSATSAGANYEEARGAQSRPDFVHKLQISLKELRESAYWIKLASRLELKVETAWSDLAQESEELVLILSKSVATTKGVAK